MMNRVYPHARLVAGIIILLLFFSGCSTRSKQITSPYEQYPHERNIPTQTKMGYSIQVGAFSHIDNAIVLTKALEKQGLTAFYFAHSSGLYKVRFGNYPTQAKASLDAIRLEKHGIINEYFIVNPGEYVIARGRTSGKDSLREEIVDTAQSFMGLPYQWGASSPEKALDCSGLVMAVYQLNGLNLPRTSEEQFKSGIPLRREELEKGDLVFFSTTGNGRVSHVGIYIGEDTFIHAPGRGKTICTEKLSDSYYLDHFYGACTYLR